MIYHPRHGVAMDEEMGTAESYEPGERVEVEARGAWNPGRVLGRAGRGLWEVTYHGLAAIVGGERLRRVAIEEPERYEAGATVSIVWRGKWYEGRVLRVVGEQLWEVAYDGWDASWNEFVGPERLRADVRVIEPLPSNLEAGASVQVLWGVRWYDAHVVRAAGEQRWEISYDGWDAKWNEVVGPDRMRGRAVTPAGPEPAKTDWAVGDAVSVLYRGRWWPGHVTRVAGPTSWEISYDGWGANWNEVVGPDRLRSVGAEGVTESSLKSTTEQDS